MRFVTKFCFLVRLLASDFGAVFFDSLAELVALVDFSNGLEDEVIINEFGKCQVFA